MGITKTEIFTDEQNKMASLFKVLGHPARIAILQYIIDQKTCICNDLIDELGLAQATISQHLKELKNMGIIKGSIEGKIRVLLHRRKSMETFPTAFQYILQSGRKCQSMLLKAFFLIKHIVISRYNNNKKLILKYDSYETIKH